ncbi:DUF2750 domain-containing protein [Staphylococcus schweitzeri]|uniref:DUF2750 domain-containing protein n=1 Tax=Staphylococcus schweitzeri TaxID=1654388 RepID=A0A2K4AEZ5_9STAP|nr:DUF2750 domain-containing protein [Staphylococcus schweitzeri]MBE2129500.1 DUF2750 domain-containing protein [Staphylococcus schweitzeri]PNZ48626.1 DUF2750 domain-containing protein [Staphylococcus schweitzeri]CDR29424.1 Protein of unknown function (DUF2750) [Staphylococcus schweitzeri]CDR54686.1 Protein of unknown function (DUF2750) [Staphylococcus schweitzeri]VEE66586.1 Protein of uncharacterised function (DUF2750) [Staphylococcus schweitzeri]
MSYKTYSFFRDILINEYIYFASKNKKLVRLNYKSKDYIGVWTDENMAESFLTSRDIPFDKVVKMDVDRFATYELDDLFDEQDYIVMNQTIEEEGHLLNVVSVTQEIMTELDKIRIKEFVQDVAKYDEVYGLTKKGSKQFILISENDNDEKRPHIMPVWSIKSRALKVRDEDFEECDLITIEGSVFSEWLDELRDDQKAVAIDLKTGVVGTIVSAQKLSNELTF